MIAPDAPSPSASTPPVATASLSALPLGPHAVGAALALGLADAHDTDDVLAALAAQRDDDALPIADRLRAAAACAALCGGPAASILDQVLVARAADTAVDAAERAASLDVLAARAPEAAWAACGHLVTDGDARVRAHAVRLAVRALAPDGAAFLQVVDAALRDSAAEVRCEATLGLLRAAAAVVPARAAVAATDADATVRRVAVVALVQCGAVGEAGLVALAADNDPTVRQAAHAARRNLAA